MAAPAGPGWAGDGVPGPVLDSLYNNGDSGSTGVEVSLFLLFNTQDWLRIFLKKPTNLSQLYRS